MQTFNYYNKYYDQHCLSIYQNYHHHIYQDISIINIVYDRRLAQNGIQILLKFDSATNHPDTQPINNQTNQSTNQPNDQPTDQPTNKPGSPIV